jgi:hypothetical protein
MDVGPKRDLVGGEPFLEIFQYLLFYIIRILISTQVIWRKQSEILPT